MFSPLVCPLEVRLLLLLQAVLSLKPPVPLLDWSHSPDFVGLLG